MEVTSDNMALAGSAHGDTTTDDSDGDVISSVSTDNARKHKASLSVDTLSRSSSASKSEFRTLKGEDSTQHHVKTDISVINSEKPKQIDQEKKKEEMRSERDGIDDVLVPKSKSKLGKIGGKSNFTKSSNSNEHDLPSFESSSIPSRDSRKHATLDAQDKVNFSLSSDPDSLRKVVNFPEKSPFPQRETSQERANHRREQLKRDLEATSATAIRKKRKF